DTKAYSQDPFTLKDYYKQVSRWTLGFWQTIRRHRVWPSSFWAALSLYILEVVVVSFVLLLMALLGLFVALGTYGGDVVMAVSFYEEGFTAATALLPSRVIAVGLVGPDAHL